MVISFMIKPMTTHSTEKIEPIQYNSSLVITGAIMGNSKEKLYQEPGLESL